MGIIIRQSFWNMVVTYAGFALGAVNTLFLYTNFFSTENYGLVMSLVSTAAIVMPFIAAGMNNALVRFLPLEKDKDRLLSFTLFIPAMIFVVLGAVVYTKGGGLADFFPQGNVIRDFVPLVFWIAAFSAFFEVFFGYAQAHMRSTEGVFLREMFYRIATTILLFAVHFGYLGEVEFCYWLTGAFALRFLIMAFVAYRCRPFRLKAFEFKKYRKIISYGLFSSMGMAIWAALLEFDKSILPFFESLTTTAYYTTAVFIGMAVAVPYRSLYQIANPILAKAIAEKDVAKQNELSMKSSMNSLILCGGIFLLINCNIHGIYRLIPPGYQVGVTVVLVISLAKLFDSISGLAGSFIVYSKYFRWDLIFSFCLMGAIIGSNFYFIPRWGMNGAAVATLVSLVVINSLRIGFVYRKTGHFPFQLNTLVLAGIIAVFYLVFSRWDMAWGSGIAATLGAIILKSLVITALFGWIVYKSNFSPELSGLLRTGVSKAAGLWKKKA